MGHRSVFSLSHEIPFRMQSDKNCHCSSLIFISWENTGRKILALPAPRDTLDKLKQKKYGKAGKEEDKSVVLFHSRSLHYKKFPSEQLPSQTTP